MAFNFTTSAPLHLNGELVATQIKRNALDQENKSNWSVLQNGINYNSSIVGSGLQTDNIGTGVIKPRNLSKQMGSKDFYYYDPAQGTNYNTVTNPKWYVAGLAGGSQLTFFSNSTKFISNTTPLSVVVADSNSTIECDINFGYNSTNANQNLLYINDIELSTTSIFTSILQVKTVSFTPGGASANTRNRDNKKISFLNLAQGTYYIRSVVRVDATFYSYAHQQDRTTIDYQVYNQQTA